MFNLIETTGIASRSFIASFDAFEAAEAAARDRFAILHFEADADYPGCADFITKNGVIGCIEQVSA